MKRAGKSTIVDLNIGLLSANHRPSGKDRYKLTGGIASSGLCRLAGVTKAATRCRIQQTKAALALCRT